MAMTKERRNEIAYTVLLAERVDEFRVRDVMGLQDDNEIPTAVGRLFDRIKRVSPESNISKQELLEFAKQFMPDLYSRIERQMGKSRIIIEQATIKK